MDAQALGAVRAAVASWTPISPEAPDLAFVAHGAVGALLLAQLAGAGISRSFDQPLRLREAHRAPAEVTTSASRCRGSSSSSAGERSTAPRSSRLAPLLWARYQPSA